MKGMSQGQESRIRDASSVAIAAALAVLIYFIREVLPNPNEGVTNLYAIPIAIVAVRFGAIGGTAAALVSLALFATWETTSEDIDVGVLGYVSRGTAFLVLGVIVGRFATERRTLIRRLEKLATTDPLTGLLNRASVEAAITVELARSQRQQRPGALLYADLDRFKTINDTLGHQAGDAVLRRVATLFQQHLRGIDTIGRIGGDEFVIVLPDTGCGDAEAVARKLAEAVAGAVHEAVGTRVKLGLSVGCVDFDGHTTQSALTLLQYADEAMYRNKSTRRTEK